MAKTGKNAATRPIGMQQLILFIFSFFNLFLSDLYSDQKNEIHLIYQSIDPASIWETDWVEELLTNTSFKKIIDFNYEKVEDRAMIVIGIAYDPKLKNYLNEFKEKNYQFAIIHLSDEAYKWPTDFYSDAKFVIRNYWHKKFLDQKNVHFFPLGYKQGFWKNSKEKFIKTSTERKYHWSFAGQIDKGLPWSTRHQMLASMKQIPNYYFYETHSFADPKALNVEDYKNSLLESIFVPCPRGFWNLDSFRVCEALECGCIPIVEKSPLDYFAKFFGSYPFLAVNNWDEAPALITELLKDPIRLEKLRKDCYEWWQNDKETRKNEIAKLIEESFKKDQTPAKSDLLLTDNLKE